MRYTCGIIFYRDGQILVGHTTGQEHWDLPKGKTEGSETFKEAAVRECYEETGFEIDERESGQQHIKHIYIRIKK